MTEYLYSGSIIFVLSLALSCVLFTVTHCFGWRYLYFKREVIFIEPKHYIKMQKEIGVYCFLISLAIVSAGYFV